MLRFVILTAGPGHTPPGPRYRGDVRNDTLLPLSGLPQLNLGIKRVPNWDYPLVGRGGRSSQENRAQALLD